MKDITTKDEIYIKAKSIVEKDNNYSISYLQRKLAISYNRASIIIELLKYNKI